MLTHKTFPHAHVWTCRNCDFPNVGTWGGHNSRGLLDTPSEESGCLCSGCGVATSMTCVTHDMTKEDINLPPTLLTTRKLTEMLRAWKNSLHHEDQDFAVHMLSGFQFPRVAGKLLHYRMVRHGSKKNLVESMAWDVPDWENLLDNLRALESEWRLSDDSSIELHKYEAS